MPVNRWMDYMIHTMEYNSGTKKLGYSALCNNMDGPYGHYSKWNKSDRSKQILCDIIYTWALKKAKFIKTESGSYQRIEVGRTGHIAQEYKFTMSSK